MSAADRCARYIRQRDHWRDLAEFYRARAEKAEAEVSHLQQVAENMALALIEAQNPGIDIEAVQAMRAVRGQSFVQDTP